MIASKSEPSPTADHTGASNGESANGPLAYLQKIAGLAGLVTVLAATIYGLGLVTLWMPIYKTYNIDASRAWYAVSFIPKTVVAGHGVKSLLWPPLVTALATMGLVLMVLPIVSLVREGKRHAHARGIRLPHRLIYTAIIFVLFSLVSLFLLTVLLLVLEAIFEFSAESYIQDIYLKMLGLAVVVAALLSGLMILTALVSLIWNTTSYIAKLAKNRTPPPVSFRGAGRSVVCFWHEFRHDLPKNLLFAAVFFGALYLALLALALYVDYAISPLVANIDVHSKSSWDEYFILLTVLGGIVGGVLVYHKGFGPTQEDFFAQENWKASLNSLRKGLLPRSVRRWFFWSLGVVYSFALLAAFLLAGLNTPPLPLVDVVEKESSNSSSPLALEASRRGIWKESSQSQEKSDTRTKRGRLLGHSEGYWYVIDERESNLLVVPKRDDNLVVLPALKGEASTAGYYAIHDDTGALKVELPSEWDEYVMGKESESAELSPSWSSSENMRVDSSITASTNLNTWTRVGGVPGIYAVASRKLAQKYTDDQLLSSKLFDSHDGCEPSAPQDFDRSSYSGRMQWWNCGVNGETRILALVAAPEDRECVVLLQTPTYGEAEEKIVQHILDTFEVDCDLA